MRARASDENKGKPMLKLVLVKNNNKKLKEKSFDQQLNNESVKQPVCKSLISYPESQQQRTKGVGYWPVRSKWINGKLLWDWKLYVFVCKLDAFRHKPYRPLADCAVRGQ